MVKRFDVFLINLDQELAKNPKNTRPAVVVSPDEMNAHLNHVLIAPIAASDIKLPTRIPTHFLNSSRSIVLDQIRSVDKSRLVKRIGEVEKKAQEQTLKILNEMFAE